MAGLPARAEGAMFMFTNRRNVRIEWGDCDPAGIVFYPRYFAMFNHSTELAVETALGLSKPALFAREDFDGIPVIETRGRFLIPTRFGDDVVIETTITQVRRSSFDLHHRLTKDGALAVEAFESRVWVVRDLARPGRFRPQAIPAEFVARLSGA
jgi:4-hydroxybenzoyl-CoA thioesterase